MITWLLHCLPRVERGQAHWCGQFVVIHAPRNLSRFMGHGEAGLWLYRWTERGSEIIKRDKAHRRARGLR